MNTPVNTKIDPPTFVFYDTCVEYEEKKMEVRHVESYKEGTRLTLFTANQEGCESAVLHIIDGERTLKITRYCDVHDDIHDVYDMYNMHTTS